MVWKKQDPPSNPPAKPSQEAQAAPSPEPPAAAKAASPKALATIGPSIRIDGALRGDEDLLVEGRVDGTVHVEKHLVTVGRSGQVQANIFAKAVRVEGTVQGDLYGSEEIVIRQSGKVEGNLTAPRVTLEDGSTFRGSIDMSAPDTAKAKASVEAKATSGAKTPDAKETTGQAEGSSSTAAG